MAGGKKKDKKKASRVKDNDDDYEPEVKLNDPVKDEEEEEEEDEVPSRVPMTAFGMSRYVDMGDEEEDEEVKPKGNQDEEDDDEDSLADLLASKKKKKKKGKDKKKSAFAALEDEEEQDEKPADDHDLEQQDEDEDEDDVLAELAASKKKKKKKGKDKVKSPIAALDDEEDSDAILAELDGRKKDESGSESQSGRPESEMTAEVLDEDELGAETSASRKKDKKKDKKNKKKKAAAKEDEEDDIDAILAQLEAPKAPESVPESSESALELADSVPEPKPEEDEGTLEHSGGKSKKDKRKKKDKKAGKAGAKEVEEEEDIDAILAQVEGLEKEDATVASSVQEPAAAVVAEVQPEEEKEKEEEEEGEGEILSAAAKKKKKKKEKEKEKKAKTQEGAGEGEMSAKDLKKLPKHVREMQERLARLKEEEDKRAREEEEKRKKEEEEERRLAEIERQKEEAKRRKKEKEKEKKEQLKREGKLLTGKQKEEAKRLKAMREQLLGASKDSEEKEAAEEEEEEKKPKKVVYVNKKKRGGHQQKEEVKVEEEKVEEEAVEEERAWDEERKEEEEKKEEEVKLAEEEEEEDDWDAKDWDAEEVIIPVKKEEKEEEEEEEEEEEATPEDKKAITAAAAEKSAAKQEKGAKKAPPQKSGAAAKKKEEEGSSESEEESSEEESSDEEEDDSSEEEEEEDEFDAARKRRELRKREAMKQRSAEDLRSPICCILGHVDTGKTKLLDCIRRTNVQEGEAGGITQQIGATFFPRDSIQERTKELKPESEMRVPGLLVIDTPGHESFTNLRSRGSGLCDIAILVVDIMHGMEPQTIESLNLLKMRKTPFIVAMNKVDRIYGWRPIPNSPIRASLKNQNKDAFREYEQRTEHVIAQLQEQGLNSALYYKNTDVRKYLSIVPTSAISGEGVPDLLLLLVQLTQKLMEDRLMYISEVQCTVLEVKVVEGLGTTIDVVLVNGVLHEGDTVVVCGLQGPIVTTIRALLTPHPMKELRVKGSYVHHKELKAAQGIKITAQGLEHAVAGTQLYVVGPEDDVEQIKDEAMSDMAGVMSRIDKSGEGVCVQASTLGSLEALLEFLKSPAVRIPVSGIAIGPVHKKDVMRASVMLERKKKEYAVILAFDVKVSTEAREMAEESGVRIFTADIIYHLFDQFTAYMANVKAEKKAESAEEAVFPCVLKILPNCIFNKKDPIVLGVEVLEGIAKIGTPICVPSREFVEIGRISSIEKDHKVVDVAKKGHAVAMKIVGSNPEEVAKMYGRHFDSEDELVSKISRESIDVLKENYRDDLSREDWILVVKLKKLFEIP